MPLRIADLRQRGGPGEDDFARASAFANTLGEKGDLLLFRSHAKGQTADLFNRFASALAVMAFVPGGVRAFGEHWEAAL